MRLAVLLLSLTLTSNAWADPVLYQGNGNHYELVLDANIGWFDARDAAAARSFQGVPGHLVTITSAGENAFLYSTFTTGATDHLAWTGGREPNDDGSWHWDVGPESGVQYSNGSSPVPPGSYVNWVGVEPNDVAATEDYMSFIIGGYAGFEAGWADSPETNLGSDPIVGYLVEYETSLVPVPTLAPPTRWLLGFLLAGLGGYLGSRSKRRRG